MTGVEAKPRIMPPVYFLISLIAMVGLGFVPLGGNLIPSPLDYVGGALIVVALVTVVIAARSFAKAQTTIRPFEPSSALVTHGPFRFSRNPMYTGMVTILVGTGLVLGDVLPFVVVPAFVAVLYLRFIRHEEVMMETVFGEEYRNYKERVRRWI